MRRAGFWLACCVLLPVHAPASSSEVLTDPEIDQLRDTALDPNLRLKLYIQFARARLAALETARTDPKVTDRAQETHDRLQDFLGVYDELSDNVDNYSDRKADMRKVLKNVIEADTEFQSKLRALKDTLQSGKDSADSHRYEFVLSDALDAVDTGASDHRQVLEEQEALGKQKKLINLEPTQIEKRPAH